MKNKILISIIFIGLIIMLVAKFMKTYDTEVDVILNDKINKGDLKIIINTHGYLLDGYEPDKYIGKTNIFFPIYKNGALQNYKKTKINKYSDYYIYARYKDKYAKMTYTNTLVLGQNTTNIKIFINQFKEFIYLSSSEIVPSIENITQSSFQDIETFKDDQHDMRMFKYLDQF
ncbi:hypothetical protein [Acinetobacter suaedae]|uniref:hypothetical protein n=1 Tax=Acinetobacter suaedae TaxID=2609668 RepID=UPI001E651369|nr:hypothetical protein [Acinetobacter sp. C16S1]